MISKITSHGGLMKLSAVALLAGLLLTGCGQNTSGSEEARAAPTASPTRSATPTAKPKPTVTASPKPTSYVATLKDPYRGLDPEVGSAFVDLAIEGNSSLGHQDIGGMVDLALDICAIYGWGGTNDEVAKRMVSKPGPSFNVLQGIAIRGAGIATFCPEYTELSERP
ncbi:DUF732 domain-containing protein [Arthrobacter sp. MDT2-16]